MSDTPTFEKIVISQLRGLETRYVNTLAKRMKDVGEREVFVPLLPRSIGSYWPWDLDATTAECEIAGYRYPIDMILSLTQRWLDEFDWTIGGKQALAAANARAEEYRKDAERYRAKRDMEYQGSLESCPAECEHINEQDFNARYDAAIDAAKEGK